jgi:hypothetical protein
MKVAMEMQDYQQRMSSTPPSTNNAPKAEAPPPSAPAGQGQ